jgi:hypothetical protein
MKNESLAPEDRAYLREVITSTAGRRWMQALILLRPAIGGATADERAFSASEAMGYERAVANMATLLEDPRIPPETKSVPVAED